MGEIRSKYFVFNDLMSGAGDYSELYKKAHKEYGKLLQYLYDIVKAKIEPVIVEFGSGKCRVTLVLSEACQGNGKIFSFDILDEEFEVIKGIEWYRKFYKMDVGNSNKVLNIINKIDILVIDITDLNLYKILSQYKNNINDGGYIIFLGGIDSKPFQKGQRKEKPSKEKYVNNNFENIKKFFYDNQEYTLQFIFGSTGLAILHKDK